MADVAREDDGTGEPSGTTVRGEAQDVREVRVGEVCDLADEGRKVPDRLGSSPAVGGAYPLYREDCARSSCDDYGFEAGGVVMVSAIGRVLTGEGTLIAVAEPGRCSAVRQLHALVPHDRSETAYIQRVLSTSPKAARFVTGTAQLRELSPSALRATRIPWPDADVRSSFVRALEELDDRRRAARRRIAACYARGDAAFARAKGLGDQDADAGEVRLGDVCAPRRGTDVPARMRGEGKPVRVEGPLGGLGRCDEPLCSERALVVGPSARRLVAHIVDEPCHPIAETVYLTQGDSEVDLAVLLFALRARGVFDGPRAAGRAGAPATCPRSLDDLAGLRVSVGDAGAHAAFAGLARALVAQVTQAERELGRIEELRRDAVARLTGDAAGRDPAPSREPALDPLSRARLGGLAGLTELAAPWGLSRDDLAWELAPMAVLRCCLAPDAWEGVARPALRGDLDGVVAALDAGLATAADDDLLSFMPNLSYGSSLLTSARLAECVRALDGLNPADVDGSQVRALFQTAGDAGEGIPASVAAIAEAVALSCCPDPALAYVPCESDGFACDLLARAFPRATVRALFAEFSDALCASLVRAVQTRPAGELRGGLGAAVGSALVADEFADWRADIVVGELPPDDGAWCDGRPDPDDARWLLGTPPRARSSFAWVEQALSHQAPGGSTVLLMSDAPLIRTNGSEPLLRRRLVEQGRVRCVVSLPAGLFADGRPASSLVVLGDQESSPRTLFVSALGRELALSSGARGPRRVLGTAEVERVVSAVCGWLETGACPDDRGFSRVLSREEVLVGACALTGWAHV